jgi:predicted DNA binding protein
MFKKRKAVAKHHQRSTCTNTPDADEKDDTLNDSDEDDHACATRILSTKQKRQFMTDSLLYAKRSAQTVERHSTDTNNHQVTNTASEADEQGVWERKHHQAMQEFIQDRITVNKVETLPKVVLSDEQVLYQQLAQQAKALSGRDQIINQNNDEVESGGAMAGTGIVEVVLPSRRSDADTTRQPPNANSLPSNWQSNQAVPSRFAVTARTSHLAVPDITSSTTAATTQQACVDDERPGFAALRKPTLQYATTRKPKKKASDDKVYREFVTRERNKKK